MAREEELQQAEEGIDYATTKIAPTEVVKCAYKKLDLSSLWHDASEMPERFKCEILYETGSENGFEVTYMPEELDADNWWNVLKVCGIVRWAYISDLLPKGGEK